MLNQLMRALDPHLPSPVIAGAGDLPSVYAVSELAAASVGAAGAALSNLLPLRPHVTVDRRLASLWFQLSIRPQGWELPPVWDPVAGDYRAADGWIRLHTNAPHHRRAAERVLGFAAGSGERAAFQRAIAGLRKADLEAALVAAGGCAAQMFTREEWMAHAQGKAVSAEPLIATRVRAATRALRLGPPERPLRGVRVLDLTRVLAGPVGTRFLAGYGAQVLRIDPPHWDEPGVVPEITLGKRCARLDLHRHEDRETFQALLSGADVLVHGYRPGALEGLGLGPEARRQIAPGLVDVSLCAYGYTGPWAGRRGFDSLVQMSCGIAAQGMRAAQADKPIPLPVQALDFATGYLMAAAALVGLGQRARDGRGFEARLSLARTAEFLAGYPTASQAQTLAPAGDADLSPDIEHTAWGKAKRLLPPLSIDGVPMRWDLPAGPLGTSPAMWPA